jgi:hypothetical protein
MNIALESIALVEFLLRERPELSERIDPTALAPVVELFDRLTGDDAG